jgi:hypothetical protein
MQRSYTSLHLHSPILRPCRRKQNCFEAATAAIGTRYPWRRRWLGHKITTPGFFFQNPPPKNKGCACAVADRALGHSASARGCCGANATTLDASRLRAFRDACLVCLVFPDQGSMSHATRDWLRQTLVSCALDLFQYARCSLAQLLAKPRALIHAARDFSVRIPDREKCLFPLLVAK